MGEAPSDSRCAIVTGAASGIGLAIASALHSAHWRVAILDNASELAWEAANAKMPGALSLLCDVSRTEDVDRAMAHAASVFGRLDLLVNNAGILGPEGYLKIPDETFARVIEVNLLGPLYLCKRAIPLMLTNGGGVIINIASIAAIVGSMSCPSYAASKGGLLAVTTSLARLCARHNIRVNCICPGSVADTGLLESGRGTGLAQAERLSLIKKIPLGRMMTPADVADLVLFMASPACSGMTGSAIVLDGGEML